MNGSRLCRCFPHPTRSRRRLASRGLLPSLGLRSHQHRHDAAALTLGRRPRQNKRAFLMVVFMLSVVTGRGLLLWGVETIRERG
jgi:hypothetical protein